MSVDRAALQGGILCGYAFPRAAHVFAAVHDPAAGRAWLAALLPRTTSAAPWAAKPDVTTNVALSAPGLARLGAPTALLVGLPADVREGMAARAADLGDTGDHAPATWEPGLDDRRAGVVVTLHVREDDAAALDAALQDLAPPPGVEVLAVERCRMLHQAREHFGFRDGLSQPSLADDAAGPWHGTGTPPPLPEAGVLDWDPLAVGEFVLGHDDEDGDRPPAPPAPLDTGTSFLVLRKLHQDVAAWRAWLLERARGDGADAARLAAHLVGRWPNGTPVATSPDAPDPRLDEPWVDAHDLGPDERARRFALLNDFRFDGSGCPATAHVRRVNPRDAFGDGRRVRRHRLLRRGMPYGEPLPDGAADDGAPRGLWFACFQASIERQFELVQRAWLADGDAFGLGRDRCVVAAPADPEGKVVLPGPPARVLAPTPRAVRLRGGGYFVVPSLPALEQLTAEPNVRGRTRAGASPDVRPAEDTGGPAAATS